MSVARIAKIKFNENAKRPAWFNSLPEANHNEMIGFSQALGAFGLLYLHDPDSHPRIQHRFNVLREVFAREGLNHVAFREWEMPGRTRIQKVLAALAFSEWCSYTLALLDHSLELAQNLGQTLADLLADRNALLVASSDLSHFCPQTVANRLDARVIDAIEHYDPASVIAAEADGRKIACGHGAIAAVMIAAQQLGAARADVLHYATSGDVSHDYQRVVGYAAALFY